MNSANKINKSQNSQLSEDLSNLTNIYDNKFKKTNFQKLEDEDSSKNRCHTTPQNSKNRNESKYKDNETIKRVKFLKIDIINIENWKKYNSSLNEENNLDKLINIKKKKKDENVYCSCLIL